MAPSRASCGRADRLTMWIDSDTLITVASGGWALASERTDLERIKRINCDASAACTTNPLAMGSGERVETVKRTELGAHAIGLAQASGVAPLIVMFSGLADGAPEKSRHEENKDGANSGSDQQSSGRRFAKGRRKSRRQPLIASSMRRRPKGKCGGRQKGTQLVHAARPGKGKARARVRSGIPRKRAAAVGGRAAALQHRPKPQPSSRRAKLVVRRVVWLSEREAARPPARKAAYRATLCSLERTAPPRPPVVAPVLMAICRAGNAARSLSSNPKALSEPHAYAG